LGIRNSLVGAIVTAAVSTAADYLWANALPHGQPIYWFAHAIVLFLTVGFCLGLPSRKPLNGALGAAAIGCAATLGFYFLQPLVGYSALFVLFIALWLAPPGWDYARHFIYWTIAYLPGFAALLTRSRA
jgi:hypothetical protein